MATTKLAQSLEAARAHTRHIWRDGPPRNADGTVNAYIEISRGDQRKWELDMRANARAIDRMMPDTLGGYPVNYGSSFVLAVSYEDGGPRADAILTYSQSANPQSPHAADQTARYAQPDGGWRPVLFTRAAIDKDPALRVQEVAAP